MSQRSFFLAAVLLLCLVGGVVATLTVLVRQEQPWYTAAGVPPGPERTAQSQEFFREFCDLYNSISNEREWFGKFTDTQINSYFEEDFVGQGHDRQLLPDRISQPRVAFEQDRIRLAFRYGRGLTSSVISIDLRVWLPANEANTVALELVGFHAGSLPISAQSLLEKVAEIGRKNGIDVNWYRHNGHPVALLRFQPDQPRPTFQLQAVQLKERSIMIQGRMIDSTPIRPAEPVKPVAVP